MGIHFAGCDLLMEFVSLVNMIGPACESVLDISGVFCTLPCQGNHSTTLVCDIEEVIAGKSVDLFVAAQV